jgi:hypothetical protein
MVQHSMVLCSVRDRIRERRQVWSLGCGENMTWRSGIGKEIYTQNALKTAIRRCGLTGRMPSWYGLSLVALPDRWQGHATGKAARCRGHAIAAATGTCRQVSDSVADCHMLNVFVDTKHENCGFAPWLSGCRQHHLSAFSPSWQR